MMGFAASCHLIGTTPISDEWYALLGIPNLIP